MLRLASGWLLLCLLGCARTASYGFCGGKKMIQSGGLTCQDRQAILDGHNRVRQSVALGQVASQPSASDMLEMVWDEELALVAQKWADQCIMGHDGSRNVARFPVGQNIAATWTTRSSISPEPDFQRQITSWFNEVRHFSFYSSHYGASTGHYSQLIWGETYLVGCGYSFYYDRSKGYTKLYVCNYGPGGNVIGSHPYTPGAASCASLGLSSSRRYQGLCDISGSTPLGSSCGYSSPSTSYSSPHPTNSTGSRQPFTSLFSYYGK